MTMRLRVRPWLLLILICICGFLAGAAATWSLSSDDPDDMGQPGHLARPSPALSPSEVVRLQVESLRGARDPADVKQCYAFASPANRHAVGHVNRFYAMLNQRTYRPLLLHTLSVIGRPVISGDHATVLVTLVDEQRKPHVFRFFLSRQNEKPYEDCWMTDAVSLRVGS